MFNRHGDVLISVDNQIINVELTGAFNYEGAKYYSTKIKRAINSLKIKKFAVCVDIRGVEGGTPEAFQELEQLNSWLNSNGLIAKAFVKKGSFLCQLLRINCPSLKEQCCQGFASDTPAHEWLNSLVDRVDMYPLQTS